MRWEDHLNMTYLALTSVATSTGSPRDMARCRARCSRSYRIDAITNGVHAATWTCQPFQALFDRHMPSWREDNFTLRYALSIPLQDVMGGAREGQDGS